MSERTYIIVSTTDSSLTATVNRRMQEGWHPVGGPYLTPDTGDRGPRLNQAMVRDLSKTGQRGRKPSRIPA